MDSRSHANQNNKQKRIAPMNLSTSKATQKRSSLVYGIVDSLLFLFLQEEEKKIHRAVRVLFSQPFKVHLVNSFFILFSGGNFYIYTTDSFLLYNKRRTSRETGIFISNSIYAGAATNFQTKRKLCCPPNHFFVFFL